MLDTLKKINVKKTGILPQEFYLEQQESRFFQAKMQRNSTLTVQRQFFVQKNVL